MHIDLISDIDDEELVPPVYYPIEYAVLWVANAQRPINLDYAKIFYVKPSIKSKSSKLEFAKRRLYSFLRSGKISARTMEYEKNAEGKHFSTGRYIDLPRECWGGNFSWDDYSLSKENSDGDYWEYTQILLNTQELIDCIPLDQIIDLEKAKKASTKEAELLPKERDSLLKLLIGLVLTNYEYNPNASRNSTSREIVGDLELHGLSIDEDTVRKWLNEAKELIPIEPSKIKT